MTRSGCVNLAPGNTKTTGEKVESSMTAGYLIYMMSKSRLFELFILLDWSFFN